MYVRGRPILVDPGWLTYEASDPMCAHGKSTRAHNTLTLNGWNQSEADPSCTRCWTTAQAAAASSDYEGGYWPGQYRWSFNEGKGAGLGGSHNRTMLWVRDRFVFVVDNFSRDPIVIPEPEDRKPALEFNWQFDAAPVEVDPVHRRVFTRYDGSNLLMLFPFGAEDLTMSLHAGTKDPIRGWLPSSEGFVAAPQLVLEQRPMAATWIDLVTLLIPFEGVQPPEVTTRATAWRTDHRFWQVTLNWPDGTAEEVRWTYRVNHMIGADGEVNTDGSLLYLCRDASGHVRNGSVFDATFAAPWRIAPQPVKGSFDF
jgi:hypothetical protein